MRDGVLEDKDIPVPLPIKRRSDNATIGVLDDPDDNGISRLRPLQGCDLHCDAYVLYPDAESGEWRELDLHGGQELAEFFRRQEQEPERRFVRAGEVAG